MLLTGFRAIIIYHAVALVVVALTLGSIVTNGKFLFVPVALVIALCAVTLSLIRYVERRTKDLSRFLLSVRERVYIDARQGAKAELPADVYDETLKDIMKEFSKVAMERELHYQYLKTLNENIGVGILTVNEDGTIAEANKALKRMLQLYHVTEVQHFQKVDPSLADLLPKMSTEGKELIKIFVNEEQLQLAIQMKEMIIREKKLKIFLFQNIKDELDQKELEAWQQLIGILTHEIMNSVTPITSLTKAIRSGILDEKDKTKSLADLNQTHLDDLRVSVDTIIHRGEGLMRFVNNYKSLTKVSRLQLEEVDIVMVIRRIIDLLGAEIQDRNIILNFIPSDQRIVWQVDVVYFEQVIINLLKNAMEAMNDNGNGVITIRVDKSTDKLTLAIIDNGVGMDPETLSRIFIPFYSTKERGSGVGLSLARQIMRLHNGSIKVKSSSGEGSRFDLEFYR